MQGAWAAISGLQNMLRNTIEANVIHRNIVISACASVAAWSSAWAVLKNFRAASVEATAISYGAAVASVKHGWHRALALSDALLLYGLRSNSIIMTSVAAAMQQGLQWQRSLVLAAGSRALPPSVICQNALASAYGKCALWPAALHILMAQKSVAMQPDASTVGTATDAFACSRLWKSALHILHGMMDWQIRCHQIAYHSAASACAADRCWREVYGLLERMAFRLTELTARSFNVAISTLPETAKWSDAFALLEALSSKALEPSTVSFNSKVDACGHWASSVAILETMRAEDTAPDRLSCNSALSTCSSDEAWQMALSIAGQSHQHESLDVIGMDSAACACQRHWEEVLNLIAGLLPKTVRPSHLARSQWNSCMLNLLEYSILEDSALRTRKDIISYNSSISACEQSWTQGLECFSAVLRNQLLPDLVTYNAACHSSSPASWLSSLMIFSHLNHSKLAADKVSCGTVLDACSLGFSWGGALQTLQQMHGQTLRANAWTISSAVRSCEMSLHPSTALGFVLRS
ncbi:PPR10 [Symbiodinium sp. CCMP2456]|nr:PPR10 [Symbiodinium sp. CCMP2456]